MAGEIIRPSALPDRPSPVASEKVPVDNGSNVGGATIEALVNAGRPLASQAEAEAGVQATKAMTPLTTKQAINALGDARFASAAQGATADSAVQSLGEGSGITVDATDPQKPVVSYTGAGVSDGDKGDVTVAGSGLAWAINADVITPEMQKDENALGFRMASNVRGRVNFFDFLQETRTLEVRDEIMNGTFTGDLAVEWQAFHAALKAISDAGGRPYGFIPECTIYTSVSPNFGMDYLRLETQGSVRVINTAGGSGILFDGRSAGLGGYGYSNLDIDPIEASTTLGGIGYDIMWCHKSTFRRPSSIGGDFAGISFRSCVTSVLDTPTVTPAPTHWIKQPSISIYVGSIVGTTIPIGDFDMQCSWSTLINPIGEYGINACILLDNTLGITVLGGTAEGGSPLGFGRGLVLGADTLFAKIIGLDCEANEGDDILCLGGANDFIGVDTQVAFRFAGGIACGNKVFGGKHGLISLDSNTKSNLINGAAANALSDGSVSPNQNRLVDCIKLGGDLITAEGWHNDWQAYTSTLSASSGAPANLSATGSFKRNADNTIDFKIQFTPGVGGAGVLQFTLPTTSAVDDIFNGIEIGGSGRGVVGAVSATGNVVNCFFSSDGSYPGGSGTTLRVSGTYRKG